MSQREAWLVGAPLAHTNIFLGHHVGVLGLDPEVNISHLQVQEAGVRRPAKRVSMVIEELAVHMDIGVAAPTYHPRLRRLIRS